MTNSHIATLVIVAASVTWALRALPFAALAPLRHSVIVRYLSLHMPLGVMAILTIYAIRESADYTPRHTTWLFIAVAATVGVHLWKRQAVLSILLGTGCYVILMSALG